MSKYKIAKIVNIIVCISLVIFIMRIAYNTWSMYGPYTLFSFFVSLFVHGGFWIIIYLCIDWVLKKLFK